MKSVGRIVVVSNNTQIREIAQEVAHEVFVADDLGEALDIVNTVTPDMTVFDERVTPHRIGEFLRQTDGPASASHRAIVAVIGSSPFPERDYKNAGVSHCLLGQENVGRLHEIAAQTKQRAPARGADTADGDYFSDDIAAAVAMVGRSKAVRQTMEMIKLVAESQCDPILVVGETGTGKELAARAIHIIKHPDEEFVAVNCAALTANLLESELFGHVKGSFTGADRDKTGLLELAGEGTIFLDEISEMPLELQAKLLRVLQEKTFRKVGGLRNLLCKATVIASSNRHLKKEVEEKRFRSDLYYRLNICPIALAPLRSPERRDDIRLLAEYFFKTSTICGSKQDRIRSITQLALESLHKHHWPGNVRELRNVIERAILLEETDKIGLSSIMIEPSEGADTGGSLFNDRIRDFSLEKAERELIARALHETGWQKTQAAAMLGITRATLYAKVKQYNIQQERRKPSEAPLGTPPPTTPQPVAAG